MIIETKYNVGDKVWFLNEKQEAENDTIAPIMTHTDGKDLAVSYFFSNHSPKAQKDVYESKPSALLTSMTDLMDDIMNDVLNGF